MKSHYLMEDLPKEERPRERLKSRGANALSDAELLGILMGTGVNGISTVDLARSLLKEHDDSLSKLSQASFEELQLIHGIGPAKACAIHAAFTLARRLSNSQAFTQPHLNTPEVIGLYLKDRLSHNHQEEFHVLALNTKNFLIKDISISVGLIDRSPVHCREVFREAIRCSSAKIILAHNHPSDDPTPSRQDIETTKSLIDSGDLLGIPVIDHIIVGKNSPQYPQGFLSMRKQHLIQFN